MFILAKSFTNKRGEMFLKIFPKQYPSIETAHAAMQSDYQEELKKRHLDRSDEEAIPYSLDCHRLILVDESHYFETIDIFDDYDIDFDVIGNF